MSAFLRDFDMYFCKLFDGARHDSGDPFAWGERLLEHYAQNRVDARTKTMIFSDGLDVDMIEEAYHHFHGRVRMSFGWGTNLTNDFIGCSPRPNAQLDPISLVCKVSEANGHPAVKLSDNPEKATGDAAEIGRYIGIFGDKGRVSHKVTV